MDHTYIMNIFDIMCTFCLKYYVFKNQGWTFYSRYSRKRVYYYLLKGSKLIFNMYFQYSFKKKDCFGLIYLFNYYQKHEVTIFLAVSEIFRNVLVSESGSCNVSNGWPNRYGNFCKISSSSTTCHRLSQGS